MTSKPDACADQDPTAPARLRRLSLALALSLSLSLYPFLALSLSLPLPPLSLFLSLRFHRLSYLEDATSNISVSPVSCHDEEARCWTGADYCENHSETQ